MTDGQWRLEGLDTFAWEYYRIPGTYETEEEARQAALERLAQIERAQPTSQSGGQALGGIQDRVYVIAPDGTGCRVVP